MGQTWTFGYTRGGIMWAGSRTSTGAESLEYFTGSSWPFDIYHRYWQELRCYCDIRCWSGTLLWGRPVWRHLVLVSSVKQVCLLLRPGIIEVGPTKKFLAFIPYRLRTNERTEETSISFSCMPSVVKDWLPFSTRSCTLGLVTHFPIRFKLIVLWHPVSTCAVGRLSQTRHHVLQQWNGCRNVTLPVDRWCVWSASVYANPESSPYCSAIFTSPVMIWPAGL
jgi:hypothetical protein